MDEDVKEEVVPLEDKPASRERKTAPAPEVAEEAPVVEAPKPAPKAKKKVKKAPAPKAEKVEDKGQKLIRMTRGNGSFVVKPADRKYSFTREHPFQLVDDADVEAVLAIGGFEVASPAQVESYYS